MYLRWADGLPFDVEDALLTTQQLVGTLIRRVTSGGFLITGREQNRLCGPQGALQSNFARIFATFLATMGFFSTIILPYLAYAETPLEDAQQRALACETDTHDSVRLLKDRNAICLRGKIDHRMAQDFLATPLADSYWIVVNSGGGDADSALEIAERMLAKRANVVAYNVCFSACANYIFLAGALKILLPHSVLAWHGGPLHIVSPIVVPEARQRILDVAERSDRFFIETGIIKDLIYFPPFNADGTLDRSRKSWTVSQHDLEKIYHVAGIYYYWDAATDPEFIAAKAAGRDFQLRLSVP